MEDLLPKIQELLSFYGLKVIAAIVIYIVGRWVAKAVRNFLQKRMTKREVDKTIISFTTSLIYIALLTFVIIAALAQLGIQTTSFIALIGAAGLAIGFAMQGTLANFAAGFLLIVFRPFKAGDYISGAGVDGVVEGIQIFTTHLKTPDNKAIIIPNGKLMGDIITNFSAKETRRVDMTFGVSYSDDLKNVRKVLQEIVDMDPRILKEPESMIVVLELADSSVNFAVRVWVKTEDYWGVFFDMNEAVKLRFDKEGISIPFPQTDVHMVARA
ncbi:MAG: mechanosensitive ion channel [Deltaproteobacteria bacterium]|nr:mechanosensitive ion channel [Deltaproteobacteria bacterium]